MAIICNISALKSMLESIFRHFRNTDQCAHCWDHSNLIFMAPPCTPLNFCDLFDRITPIWPSFCNISALISMLELIFGHFRNTDLCAHYWDNFTIAILFSWHTLAPRSTFVTYLIELHQYGHLFATLVP